MSSWETFLILNVLSTGCRLFSWASKCLCNWSMSLNALSRIYITGMFWFLQMVCGGGREKNEKRFGTQRKTPAQLVWTEDRSHDLNILEEEICPHCRQTCRFSSVRGLHQWSIVSVLCDGIVLPHGWFSCSDHTVEFQKKCENNPFFSSDSTVIGQNVSLNTTRLYVVGTGMKNQMPALSEWHLLK